MNRPVRRSLGTFLVIACAAAALAEAEPVFEAARPGYDYSFPRDHGAHESFRTEWWYYTGHLVSEDGKRFGYQLTFFRQGMDHPSVAHNPSRWAVHHLYLAHFALTEEDAGHFFFAERVNRAGVGRAGAEETRYHVWNGDWFALEEAEGRHRLFAAEGGLAVDLTLWAAKPPVVHGRDGVSRKGQGPGQSSHYYSITRMKTEGEVRLRGRRLAVKGASWMDHEFGSTQLSGEQAGWDWFGLQLDDGTELMFYRIRGRDGRADPFSAGTLVFPDGRKKHLALEDFRVEATGRWKSPQSAATYPSGWRVAVPSEALSLQLSPTVLSQELITEKSTGVTYWEGSVRVEGSRKGEKATGKGYVELTGYAGALSAKF